MEFDPVSQGEILFGGFSESGTPTNLTWEYKSYVWTNLTPFLLVSPPARYHASMATSLFPLGLILFGGQSSGTGYLGDTWYWNGTAWLQVDLAGLPTPAPRTGAAFTFDYVDSFGLLFGGTNGSLNFNDTWAYSGLAWTQLHPTLSPAGRYYSSITWDETDHYVVLFGGTANAGTGLADTWSYALGNWTNLNPGTPPVDLVLSDATYDYRSHQMLLFGGLNPENCTTNANTWWYATGLWRLLTSPQQGYPAPSPRDGSVIAFDEITKYVVLFGGETGSCSPLLNVNDTWIYGPWTGPPPSPMALSLTASPSSGAAPLATTLEVHVTGGVAPYSVSVDPGDGSPLLTASSSGFTNFTHTFSATQNYGVGASATDKSLTTAKASTIVSVGSVMVPDWLPPRDTYQFINYGSYWSGGGNCYGISSTEILYWGHDIRGWGPTPYLPTAVPSTSWLIPPVNASSQLNSVTLAIMQHQTVNIPGQLPWYYWSSSLPGNWNYILGGLQYGVPEIMGLGWNDLHAVVVYGEQQLPNGTYFLDISDPNVPLTTTHAWYDPNANQFLYSAAGLTWHGFDYIGSGLPEELQPSWYGPFLAPNWNYTSFPLTSHGYYFIMAGQLVTVSTEQGTDSFTSPGNSQTFVQGIPESAGIEEGSVQVYAVPVYGFGGPPPLVKDPSTGPSPIQILTTTEVAGTLAVDGFSASVDSLGAHDFSIQPHPGGFTLSLGRTLNESAWANVSFYHLAPSGILQLNASMLRLADGSTANFTVSDPLALDSSTTPSVDIAVTSAGGGAPATYHLANGQVGLTPVSPAPPSTGGGGTPWYQSSSFLLGILVGGVVVAILVMAVWASRRGVRPPQGPAAPPSGAS